MVAAIAAAEAGAEVAIASKGPPALLSCTAYAGGGFTAAVGGYSAEGHRALTMSTGRGMNDVDMVDVLSREGADGLAWLERQGVALKYRRGGASMAGPSLGKLVKGTAMTMPLLDRCRALDIRCHHPVTVYGLVGEGFRGRVTGAVGRDRNGETVRFQASSIILASGGGAWTFSHTDNPRGLTGDGYLMAFAAGCTLRDMEFVQFYPLGPGPSARRTWYMDARILDRVRLTDGDGVAFLPPLLEAWGLSSGKDINMLARDRLSRVIAEKWRETGEVRLHLEDLSAADRADDRLAHRARLMVASDDDNPWRPVPVAPVAHFMCGGVVTDVHGATGIPGLWACGEVVGGVHGANRVGGNALTELTVFGVRAGRAAARAAQHHVPSGRGEQILLPDRIAWDTPVHQTGPETRDFRRQAYEWGGPYRTPESMGKLLQASGDRLASADLAAVPVEERGLYWTAATVALSALHRRESRGTHYRTDHPDEDATAAIVTLVPEYEDDALHPRVRVEPISAREDG